MIQRPPRPTLSPTRALCRSDLGSVAGSAQERGGGGRGKETDIAFGGEGGSLYPSSDHHTYYHTHSPQTPTSSPTSQGNRVNRVRKTKKYKRNQGLAIYLWSPSLSLVPLPGGAPSLAGLASLVWPRWSGLAGLASAGLASAGLASYISHIAVVLIPCCVEWLRYRLGYF